MKAVADLSVEVGSISLPNPVITASGTTGQSAELRKYVDLSQLGAVVVKSLSPYPWQGNPPPRVHSSGAGMINAVGLQNPGVEAWKKSYLPALRETGARIVASIWGRSVDEYRQAAKQLRGVEGIVAVEVNISCPNLEGRGEMFAHSPELTRLAIKASAEANLPIWAKLSPNVTDISEIAFAAIESGAEALTLSNTLMGMVIDTSTRRPVLGNGGGGVSGPGIRPVAVRAVYEMRQKLGDFPIIGVGGISKPEHAIEFIAAGANAIQIGTAHFADPRASKKVLKGLGKWCSKNKIKNISTLIGEAHG
ncbi:MAG: dihydroorotate dehydrogenase (NAD+) catalytic subunit [Candidatus Poriferisodalaceae bacterium]|jgi:dihydroorotate dehydrogenase (NAD+) catalytic subunit|nr:dihydroorotate dehydrogenase [Acidimicrobiales bacterium]|tara:strand:- start:3631 stop:4551 length:921 start_codon:yes stop_codon:yes gene_type:complete